MSNPSMDVATRVVDPSRIRAQSADLYVNSKCNLTCATCFLGDAYFHTGAQMTLDDVRAIGQWCVQARVRDVAILGGEPTLHPDIAEMFGELRSLGIERLRLVTNGNRRAREQLRGRLGDVVDLVYVSLDGASEAVNDAVRGRGSFRDATECIDLLRAREKPFVITSTLNRRAVEELDELIALAASKGAQVLNLHWLSSVGRARGTRLGLSADEWLAVCDQVAGMQPIDGLTIECQAGWRPRRDREWAKSIRPDACAARDLTNLEFMPDGRVFACGLLVDDETRNGFRWGDGALVEEQGDTERSLCCGFDGNGCPVRQAWFGESSADGRLPVCIYERIVVNER